MFTTKKVRNQAVCQASQDIFQTVRFCDEPFNQILPTFSICQDLHASRKHGPEHAIMFGEGSDGGVVQGTTDIQLYILWGGSIDDLKRKKNQIVNNANKS